MVAVASSTSNHIWRLSPTMENVASSGDNSEEKASLLHLGSGCSKSELLDSPDMPAAVSFAHPPPHFVKIPLEDRTKYEKLCSNDEITSEDSDSEGVRVGGGVTASLVTSNHGLTAGVSSLGSAINHKKAIFKQIATTNHMIHEKLHAVGQKVNKTQVKGPIVRKLKTTKTKISDSVSGVRRKEDGGKRKRDEGTGDGQGNERGQNQEPDDQDDDSIGSASDLRAEAEDDFDEQDDGRTQNGYGLRRVKNPAYDDGISQSVKTCGSSAYHAECESVATNEDDVSRVVVKVLTKKRERINDSANTIIDENQLSPSSADLLHKYGDKPLLLDDELDYDSDEHTESKDDQVGGGQSSEELDVFAMAPFKMPKSLPKKIRASTKKPPKFEPPITPIVEDPTLFAFSTPDAVKDSFWTSTPKKVSDDHQNVFSTYLTQNATTIVEPDSVQRDEFNEPIFNPFPETTSNTTTNCLQELNPSTSSSAKIPIDSQCNEIIATLQKDMFGSEPFPAHVHTIEKNVVEKNNNQIKAERLSAPQPQKKLVSLVSVNTSMSLENATNPTPSIITHSMQEPKAKYINFSKPDQMLPIADTEYVIISPTSNDDEEATVFSNSPQTPTPNASTSAPALKSSKKDKSAGKYSYLKEKSNKPVKEDAHRVVLPSILSSKVKGSSSLSYKKVKRHSKNEDEEDDSCYFQSNSLTKSNAKAGFNNMSFEDFPSDQELDCLNPIDGANRTKTTPFEVVRNEKMLLEAEKKFGSLKRRTNLFSS